MKNISSFPVCRGCLLSFVLQVLSSVAVGGPSPVEWRATEAEVKMFKPWMIKFAQRAVDTNEVVVAEAPQNLKLFLLIGQSNMAGRGALSEKDHEAIPHCLKLNRKNKWVEARSPIHFDRPQAGYGIADTFVRRYLEDHPTETVGLIPCAVGGSPSSTWSPEEGAADPIGTNYRRAVERARIAQRNGQLVGILWHQGEADADVLKTDPSQGQRYVARLAAMAESLRRELGSPDVPFLIGEIGTLPYDCTSMNPILAETAAAIPNCALVKASDLTGHLPDGVHFDTPSYKVLGERYYEAWKALSAAAGIPKVKINTASDRVKAPLRVDLECIGAIRPRLTVENCGQNWCLGCETLDRDYIDFEEYKEFVAPLGIGLVRLQGGWAKCERVKGEYDFSWLDRVVDYLRLQGIDCAIETSYGNPIYKGGGTIDLAAGFPTSEEGLAGWDAWVGELSRHFRGRVDRFLMWNEPDIRPLDGSAQKTPEQIAAFNVRTAKVILQNIPNAHIAGLSLARNDPLFFEACLKAMGEDVRLFDTMIYHGYAAAPESSYAEVETLKAILAKYNSSARMWQGENGCPSEMALKFALSHIAWSEYSQAKWNMRRMLGDLGHDVLSSVFTICDFSHSGREINLKGLLRADEQKKVIAIKRAYYAVQNVVSVFDGNWTRQRDSSFERGFGTKDASISSYHYVKSSGEPLFVFWTHGGDFVNHAKLERNCVLGEGRWRLPYLRPSDSFETRPMVFRYTDGMLKEPVWVDLLTGRVYAYPKDRQVRSGSGVRFLDVPVYDSPCLLTEKSALPLQ